MFSCQITRDAKYMITSVCDVVPGMTDHLIACIPVMLLHPRSLLCFLAAPDVGSCAVLRPLLVCLALLSDPHCVKLRCLSLLSAMYSAPPSTTLPDVQCTGCKKHGVAAGVSDTT